MKKKQSKRLSKGSWVYLSVFSVFIVICLIIAAFCSQYYKRLHTTIRDESKGYLQEVTRRIGANVDRIIADNYAVLYTMGASIEINGSNPSLADAQEILQKQKSFWNYESILMLDEGGKAYDLDGNEVFLSLEDTVRQDLFGGKQTMSTTQIINNREYILLSVPLNSITVGGRRMVALAGCYSPSSFDQVLSMTSFNNQAYSQIISKSGAIVVRSSSQYAMESGYNIFSSLKEAKLDEDSNLERIKADILANRGDQIGFTLNGEHLYMVYTPIQPDDWYLLTFVPVQVVNEKSDILLRSTLLISGLIVFAFAALCATLAFVFNNHRSKLERIAYVDEVTGGNTIQRFYELARRCLDTSPSQQYALMYTNIEKFKVLNEQMGRQNCDSILWHFYSYIDSTLSEQECMGRVTADNFCILIVYTGELDFAARFFGWYQGATDYIAKGGMEWNMPSTGFGVYVIENRDLPFTQMIDRAKLALKESSWVVDTKMHYAFYDDKLRRQLIREKQLEDWMDDALKNMEFQVYLQPKYHLPEECIGGAEALVRWQNSTEGMIYPNEFIPLFEKNGFIVQVDLFVFEQVCKVLCSWAQRSLPSVKISVNCSRVHFKNPAFLAPYVRIAEQYGVDRNFIEIELTESVVLENSERLIHIIDEIHEAGFGCSMDDFGSGYSSLNLLQTIPVDTLKLDKIFFQSSSDSRRTEAVVQSIVNMAKQLSMETVAEGVEHREQVEMLKATGCDYIQGYVFAKPMPIPDFEERAFGAQGHI